MLEVQASFRIIWFWGLSILVFGSFSVCSACVFSFILWVVFVLKYFNLALENLVWSCCRWRIIIMLGEQFLEYSCSWKFCSVCVVLVISPSLYLFSILRSLVCCFRAASKGSCVFRGGTINHSSIQTLKLNQKLKLMKIEVEVVKQATTTLQTFKMLQLC